MDALGAISLACGSLLSEEKEALGAQRGERERQVEPTARGDEEGAIPELVASEIAGDKGS